MKTRGGTTLALVMAAGALALLAGCSAPASPQEPVASVEAAPVTSAPITSTPAAASDRAALDGAEADAFFIDSISPAWRGELPAESELIAAAHLACDQIAAGAAADAIVVVQGEGEDAEWNNHQLVNRAMRPYCPAG